MLRFTDVNVSAEGRRALDGWSGGVLRPASCCGCDQQLCSGALGGEVCARVGSPVRVRSQERRAGDRFWMPSVASGDVDQSREVSGS